MPILEPFVFDVLLNHLKEEKILAKVILVNSGLSTFLGALWSCDPCARLWAIQWMARGAAVEALQSGTRTLASPNLQTSFALVYMRLKCEEDQSSQRSRKGLLGFSKMGGSKFTQLLLSQRICMGEGFKKKSCSCTRNSFLFYLPTLPKSSCSKCLGIWD